MLSTQEYCDLITALGGDPESLADKTEKTMFVTVLGLIEGEIHAPTATEVVTAIQGMSAEQKAAVKTALEIS